MLGIFQLLPEQLATIEMLARALLPRFCDEHEISTTCLHLNRSILATVRQDSLCCQIITNVTWLRAAGQPKL